MGTVYEVEDATGMRVALKLFTGGAKNRDFLEKRFRAEAKLLATLEHPHLVKVWDMGVDESTGNPWFTMDLVLNAVGEPETLEDARRRGGISNEQLLGWYRDLSEALAYLHAHGIVHRDVKLENVLVDGGGHAVLSDFGISRIFDDKLRNQMDVTTTFVEGQTTGTRPVMGTYFYLAPEVRAGRPVTPAADRYALGILFFRILTGMWYEPPSTSTETEGKRATSPFDLLLAFDPFWQSLLPRLLSDDPKMRTVMEISPGASHSRWKLWLVVGIFAASFFTVAIYTGATGILPVDEADTGTTGVLPVDNNSTITTLLIRASTRRIRPNQFKRMPNLRHVIVENGVEEVGAAAFFGCQRLETVTLPDSLKHVEGYAFGDCFALREVRFGKGLIDVGHAAFGGCSNLLHAYFGGDAPIALGTRIYVRTPTNLVNHVPPTAKGWGRTWPTNDAFSRRVVEQPPSTSHQQLTTND